VGVEHADVAGGLALHADALPAQGRTPAGQEGTDDLEELAPDEQLMELERTRDALLDYLRGLDAATLARAKPWDTWQGTIPEYLVAALRDHEAEHVAELRDAAAGL